MKKEEKIPLAVISADKEIIELAQECGNFELVGIFDVNPDTDIYGLPFLGSDENWLETKKKYPRLQVALSIDPTSLKERLAKHYGFDSLATLISSGSYVSPTAKIGKGCLVQRGVKVMADAQIGLGCKINVNAVIHHDSKIGNLCTLAPGSLLLGNVLLEDRVFVGAGAILLPRVRIGHDAIVGAGAVVTSDVSSGLTVVGVPARELIKNKKDNEK